MREIEVLRVEDDGQFVVCIDRETDEHFRLRADDELRAAARGDTTELGQVPVAGEAALRPREIQARIRAGASVAELAEIAGVSPSKIERYAHPVLLERSRAAELARASHPLTMDGPSLATLGELVAECLVLRGDVPADARWDSWKAESGQWMIQLSFHEGSTENFAHWRFRPGTHGGTTDPVDELGVELTDPELARASRRTRLAAVPVRPVPPTRPEVRADGHTEVTVEASTVVGAPPAPPRPMRVAPEPTPPAQPELDLDTGPEREAEQQAEPADSEQRTTASKHRAKRGKPAVPGWEDVLLGVRAHPED